MNWSLVVGALILFAVPAAAQPGPAVDSGLRATPDLKSDPVAGWAGVSLFRTQHRYGFSRDSRLFVACGWEPEAKTTVCRFRDLETGAETRVAAEGPTDLGRDSFDPTLQQRLDSVGAPAVSGRWPAPGVSLTWRRSAEGELVFALQREGAGAVEITRFTREKGDLAPLAALVSPDGRRLALVIERVVGNALVVDARVLDVASALEKCGRAQ